MTAIDIIVICACIVFATFVIVRSVLLKKKGKTSCGCDCSNCSSCCVAKKNKEQTN